MSDTWTVTPEYGVGPLRLGAELSEIEAKLGKARGTFTRTPKSSHEVVDFGDVHVEVSGRKVVTISVFLPRQVSIGGVKILGRALDAVLNEMPSDMAFERSDAGAWSPSSRIVLVEVEDAIDCVELSLPE